MRMDIYQHNVMIIGMRPPCGNSVLSHQNRVTTGRAVSQKPPRTPRGGIPTRGGRGDAHAPLPASSLGEASRKRERQQRVGGGQHRVVLPPAVIIVDP
jgi:hypothetical protein